MKNTTCRNCGGDYSIHQSETERCPQSGEDQTGRKHEIYMFSTFEAMRDSDEITDLRAALAAQHQHTAELEARIEGLRERAEKVNEILQTAFDDAASQEDVYARNAIYRNAATRVLDL